MTDNRIDYARAVSARTRLEIALEQVMAARRELGAVLGANHDAARGLDDVTVTLQRAQARVNVAIPRIT